MDTREYLESIGNNNKIKEQIAYLNKVNGTLIPDVFGLKGITKNEAKICLALMGDEKKYNQRRIPDYVDINTDRFNILKPMFEHHNYRYSEYKNVLTYFFGDELYKDIIKMLDIIDEIPYQDGYARRSFRIKNEMDIIILKKINLIINLNDYLKYDMEILDYLKYIEVNINYNNGYTILLNAMIRNGNNDVLNQLIDVVYNRHESLKINRTIIKTLLLSNKEEAFKAIEDLLLAAQRQEGLRQSILECLDETTIEAQKYFMNLVLENKLTRFSSVVRALDVWCGLGFEAVKETTVKKLIEMGLDFLLNPEKIDVAIKSKDNSEIYMALWAKGAVDIEGTLPLLENLLKNENLDKRMLAMYFAENTSLPHICNHMCKLGMKDSRIEVFWMAMNLINSNANLSESENKYIFDSIEERIKNVPEKGIEVTGNVFSWLSFKIDSNDFYSKLIQISKDDDEILLNRIFSHYDEMKLQSRERIVVEILARFSPYSWMKNKYKEKEVTAFEREVIFKAIKDKGAQCRSYAKNAIKKITLTKDEYIIIEDLLKSKNNELRKSIIEILLKNNNNGIKESTERLLSQKLKEYRLAGLDMLNYMKKNNIDDSWVLEKAKDYKNNNKIAADETILLDNILLENSNTLKWSKENGFGLFNPNYERTFKKPNKEQYDKDKFSFSMDTSKIESKVLELNQLFVDNKDYEYETENHGGVKTKSLLGNYFTKLIYLDDNMTKEEKANNYPLIEVWKEWFRNSGMTNKDLFILNLIIDIYDKGRLPKEFDALVLKLESIVEKKLQRQVLKKISSLMFGKYGYYKSGFGKIIEILQLSFPYEGKVDFMQDICKSLCNDIDQSIIDFSVMDRYEKWYSIAPIHVIFGSYELLVPKMNDKQFKEFWEFKMFVIRSNSQLKKNFFSLSEVKLDYVIRAFQRNLICEDEFINTLMIPENLKLVTHYNSHYFGSVNYLEKYDFILKYIVKISERVLEIELSRGDSETDVTKIAQKLYYVKGMDTYGKILNALGKDGLHTGYSYWGGGSNKREMLSFLLRNVVFLEGENQEKFDEIVKKYNISRTKLIESAVYSTIWVPFVAKNLKLPEFTSAVWWIHAHTNGSGNKANESEISKYSKVELEEFREGAVDVDWFNDVYKKLGEKAWNEIYKCGKYVTDGNGHRRAQLYADAILGKLDKNEVLKKINEKRNQDQLRMYGVIPLAKGKKAKEKDILERYKNIEKFKKESKQFGSQRQASEKLACKIAMENLSRTGGYADPIRLVWAMETNNTIDIFKRAKEFTKDDITISLKTDEFGKTFLECYKAGKLLKNVPAKLAKDATIMELKELSRELNGQQKRVVKAMQESMINRDVFTSNEIKNLMKNPVIRPIIEKLVLKADNRLGFWKEESILDKDENIINDKDGIVIAHCSDLYESGEWEYYQSYIFNNEIKQPFKQIFRELYIPTEDELADGVISRRYDGHQVAPRKTVALLKSCGWKINYDEGLQKVFYKDGIIATMYAMADWFTPSDVENPTLETIHFYNKKDWEPIKLWEVPPVIFSEIMRDIDLVVSVAHVGDVDPEASHSSIEMRAALVRETIRLFKIDNTKINGTHIVVKGKYGEYSIHLGSGIAHKVLGTSLNIIPVHSQHRGNLFLPFFDEDPKSAEIISKVILLAKDDEIQDPTILNQIR